MQVCLQRLCKCSRCATSMGKPGCSLCTDVFNFSTWNGGQVQGCSLYVQAAISGSNTIFTAFCLTSCFNSTVSLIRVTYCPKAFTVILPLKKTVSTTREEKVCLWKVVSTLLSCTWMAMNMRNSRLKHNFKIAELSWEIQCSMKWSQLCIVLVGPGFSVSGHGVITLLQRLEAD